jgi:hypothetical protein
LSANWLPEAHQPWQKGCILGLHSYLKVCELLAVSTRLILHLLALVLAPPLTPPLLILFELLVVLTGEYYTAYAC